MLALMHGDRLQRLRRLRFDYLISCLTPDLLEGVSREKLEAEFEQLLSALVLKNTGQKMAGAELWQVVTGESSGEWARQVGTALRTAALRRRGGR